MKYTAIDVQRELGGSAMTGSEALQSVQYVTVQGKRLAVININDWEALIEWLETIDDIQTAREALAVLKAAGNDRERAGWLKWDDVERVRR
jgi:hypothetical protein